ncbi:hypothetical protein Tco_0312124 [Tanacetum coccineum]
MMGGSEESKGIVMDSEVIGVQVEDDGIGVVGNDGKMSFVSVSEDMIKMYDGTSSDNRSKKVELQVIPTRLDENGVEVVVFDDVMVAEGKGCGIFLDYRVTLSFGSTGGLDLACPIIRLSSQYGIHLVLGRIYDSDL